MPLLLHRGVQLVLLSSCIHNIFLYSFYHETSAPLHIRWYLVPFQVMYKCIWNRQNLTSPETGGRFNITKTSHWKILKSLTKSVVRVFSLLWNLTGVLAALLLRHMPTFKAIPGPWFNIKMSSYQHKKSHCGDKTVERSSYLHNGISYTGKISLYWIGAQHFNSKHPISRLRDSARSL